MTLSYVGGMATPLASGRDGCKSTAMVVAGDDATGPVVLAAAAAAWDCRMRRSSKIPPEWSACQCERMTRSMGVVSTFKEAMLRAMLFDSGPVSKSVLWVSSPIFVF